MLPHLFQQQEHRSPKNSASWLMEGANELMLIQMMQLCIHIILTCTHAHATHGIMHRCTHDSDDRPMHSCSFHSWPYAQMHSWSKIQWDSCQSLMETMKFCQIKSHQIQWEPYQNLMVTMGFVRSVPIKSNENFYQNPMNSHEIRQIKSHQIQWESYRNLMKTHGICQIKSHQIQWESYQNLMDTMGFVRSNPIKSNENLMEI